MSQYRRAYMFGFQSTPPMQGATRSGPVLVYYGRRVSIHAPYAGSDDDVIKNAVFDITFQSTPPMQGATLKLLIIFLSSLCFNPRPLCRERLQSLEAQIEELRFQSTPPMQGATPTTLRNSLQSFVSIHAPYAGSDVMNYILQVGPICFNPRPLCRERPACRGKEPSQDYVSIHAPYAGSDEVGKAQAVVTKVFQSTPPMQGAT